MGFFFLVGCMVDYNPYQVTLLGIRRVNIIISKIVCLWSGRSVKEFVEACKKATGVQIKVEYLDRRPGDYAEVYSDPSKINRELNWTAQYTDLQQSLQIAWRWQKLHRNGYGGPRLSLISWLAAYCSRILDDESSLCSFVADLLRSIYFLPSEKVGCFQVDLTNIIQEVRPFTFQAWVQVKEAHFLLTVKHIQINK